MDRQMEEETPIHAMAYGGVLYDSAAKIWHIPAPGEPVRFDFGSLAGASTRLREDAKHAMQAALAQSPARSAYADFDAIRGMLRRVANTSAPVDAITPGLLQEYDASLPAGRRHLSSRLANALRRWHASGVPGLSDELPGWLFQQRPEAHDSGRAVRTLCRREGALTHGQRDGLLAALHEARAAGTVEVADYAMTLLVIVLGLRPLQVACLKVGDLRPPSDPDLFAADLLVTRLKQRGCRPRRELAVRGLTGALAEVLSAWCAEAAKGAVALGLASADCPMFSAVRPGRTAPGFAGHLSGAAVGRRIGEALGRLDIPVDCRAEGHIFPLRLRRTFATLLSIEGCRLPQISHLLDHTGPKMARAYIEASPEPAQRLGQALDAALEGVAAAFCTQSAQSTGATKAGQTAE